MNKTDCFVRARMKSLHLGEPVKIYSKKKDNSGKGTPRDYRFRVASEPNHNEEMLAKGFIYHTAVEEK